MTKIGLTYLLGLLGLTVLISCQPTDNKPKSAPMTPTEQLKAILNDKYVSEDGEDYKVELKPALTDEQINSLASKLPTGQLPNDIKELLKFSSGFTFYGPEEVTFDGIGQFGFENIIPNSVQLAGDGFGNFWILDIDSKGNWGSVFYVCHDPAVIVKHSDNLAQFIQHVDEFGKKGHQSNLDSIHEKVVMDIWSKDFGFVDKATALNSNDETLKTFASKFTDNFIFADLRHKPIKSGFAWGKFGPNIDNAKRHETEMIWAFEKKEKLGLLSRLFGRKQ